MYAKPTRAGIAVALLSTALVLIADPVVHATPTDKRYAAIDALGELNGIALQCRYIDQVRRMKAAVVRNAPKERSFGFAFDEASNRAFLQFIEQQDACPNPDNFARRVGHRIDAPRAVFGVE